MSAYPHGHPVVAGNGQEEQVTAAIKENNKK
jgi:hypothetical protein